MTEQEKYNQIIKKFEWLSLAYLISLIVFLFMVYHWMGGLIIWFSIYFFGIPLIYVLLPFLGLLMFMLKSKVRIVASFLISLTPLSYLIPALESFPFTVQTTAAGAYCSNLGSLNGRYSLECVYIFLNIYDFILVLLTSLSFKSLISQTEEVNASFSYR